jgi:hypothetical protein
VEWTKLARLLVLTLSLPNPHAWAQGGDERENLADIREVNVIVEELTDDAEDAGLRRDTLSDAIEARLEERGIPLGNSGSAADLYINVATDRGSTGLYAYYVRVSVQQLATIEGNQLRAFVDTWDLASVGTVGRGNLPEIQGVVLQIVDVFSDDYLEMNDPR